jgi:hypothetical protein
MISAEKEKVPFLRPVKVRQGMNVETWLNLVEQAMVETL